MTIMIFSDNKKEAARWAKIFQNKDFNCQVRNFAYLDAMKPLHCDAVLLVVDQPELIHKKMVQDIRKRDDNLPIIVVAGKENVSEAVRLMKEGVFDYFTNLVEPERLMITVQHAIKTYQLTKRIFLLENQMGMQTKLDQMVGLSPSMQALFSMIKNVTDTDTNILISGESGTGKELVAKAIHHLGKRNARRFIDINCGAIPKALLENELFGHERGSYTGADKRYIGCCERADGGTLFLDEIGEMDIALQVKLLRFLQERQFNRIGGTESIRTDARVIAATNRNLQSLVEQGLFREDLFYRLNVVLLQLPPLRERKEDIPILAKTFLEKYSHRNEKIFLDFAPDVMETFLNYSWPGNIRELENTIERAVVLYNDTKIKLSHLPNQILKAAESGQMQPQSPFPSKMEADGQILPLPVLERYAIEAALRLCTGNVSQAAQRLKIGQATLYRKIKEYRITT